MTLSAGTSFGGGLFGNKTTTSTFGIPTITTTSAFSFGAVKTTATAGFGLSTKTTSSGLFGSGGTGSLFSGVGTSANKGFGGFGSLATSSANSKPFGGFGGLGSNTLSSSKGFGGFGTSSNSLGAASGNSLQAPDSNDLTALLSAVSVPKVFEDDRDTIMAKFNQIQAFLGVGQGYFNKISNPINFTMENPFCKFKSVGYSCKPSEPDSAGLVALTINKKDQEVKSQQQHLVEALQKLFGNKPNLAVFVEVVKPLPENKTEVVIYLMERDAMGNSRRFSSSEVSNFLNQANLRTQLTSLGVSKVVAKADLTEEQLIVYLNNPPSGIHPILWEQARKDNPSPQRLVPVPILGFEQLQGRIKFQQQETTLHQNALEILSDDITMLQQKHTETLTKLTEYKRRFLDLSHRVLKVISKQEVKRKSGCSIQLDEEDLRIQFETQLTSLNGPTHFKGRLNELVAQLRLQQQAMGNSFDGRFSLEKSVQLDLKQHLEKQQEGLMHLTGVIRQDFEDLKLIEQGLHEPIPRR
ncbi:nucleoporin p54-like [Xenia sp. Carnegie-2017]|uniref:nucleoporin p54-like n=1 Tax=Xenia sp. Carnegie-2017 TaxID=2897299 RepID=UPI001F03ECE0|nr:nucleoporin p54-like [Xenia sp. Carnegie-2017]